MNMRISFLGLLGIIGLSFATSSMAEGVYKWEDEQGQMHYSDMPRDGATEIDIEPAQTFSGSADARIARNDEGQTGEDADSAGGYKSLKISSPSQEETIWNTGGAVTVRLSLSPALQTGHSVRLYMDGQQLANLPGRATSAKLSEVERGTHTLRAEVRDSSGNALIKAAPVTFFVKQQTADNALRTAPAKPAPSVKPQKSQQNKPRPTPARN